MARYIIKRLIYAVLTLFVLITLVFFMMRMLPGDPFLGEKAISPTALANMNAKYGLDKPVFIQYLMYMGNCLKGDLGISITYNRPVMEIVSESFMVSADLGIRALIFAVIAGILCQRGDYTGRLWKTVPEMNIFLVLLICIVIGFIWGAVNGVIITKLHVPPFIATLGTQTIIYGISLVISDAQPIGGFQKIYTQLINGRIGSPRSFHLPYLLFVALVFGIIFWVIYNKTRFGKYMYAIGGNEVAAEVSGVNTTRTLMRIYITAGIMYAIAGYLLAAKSGGASASLGQGYELEAIAGCTIGGVSTTGGIGTVPGILIGVLVFELLKIITQFLGINPYYNYVVQGLVIVLAVALDIRKYIAKK